MATVRNVKRIYNLKELEINKKVKIKEINLSAAYKKRLNLLGIKKGSKIEKLSKIRNLLIFRIKRGTLVFPENLAKKILVEDG